MHMFHNMKKVKGGTFAPEKLIKKKFELGAIDNPYDMGGDTS